MTALNTTLFSNILKTHYTGPIISLLENSTALVNRMEKKENESGGNFSYIPLETVRPGAIGARTDLSQETLPTGNPPAFNAATYDMKSLYATLTISGKSMRASRANPYAFAKALNRDMESTTNATKKDLNRQLFGTADGELAVVSAISAGTPNTVTLTSNAYPTNPTKFLHAGMIVDNRIRSSGAAATNGSGLTIASVATTATFTYTGTAFTFTASTQSLYRAGNFGQHPSTSAALHKEINGLSAIISEQNPDDVWSSNFSTAPLLGGIDRASLTSWKAQILTNSGTLRPFSLSLIEEGIDLSETAAGGMISLIQTNHAIKRVYGLQMAALKQAPMSEMKLDGGFKYLDVNGIPMVWDTESLDYHIFLIDEDTLDIVHHGPWTWIDNGNGNVLQRLQGQDFYEAVLSRDMQMRCNAPNKNVRIRDVAHS